MKTIERHIRHIEAKRQGENNIVFKGVFTGEDTFEISVNNVDLIYLLNDTKHILNLDE